MNTLINTVSIIFIQNDQLTINRVYEALSPLELEYPGFKSWFYEKVVPDVITGARKILVASFSDEIAGVLIIKDAEEKKICTLRVRPEYRRIGIGRQLMERAVHELNVDKPLITVSDMHLDEFKPLFEEFCFDATAAYLEYYRQGHTEFAFNGYLR